MKLYLITINEGLKKIFHKKAFEEKEHSNFLWTVRSKSHGD